MLEHIRFVQANNQLSLYNQELQGSEKFTIQWSESFEEMLPIWESFKEGESFFMDSKFMRALADVPPKKTSNLYALIFKEDKPVARIFGQKVAIDMSKSLRIELPDSAKIAEKIGYKFKKITTPYLNGNLLCIGHILMSGSRGVQFSKDLDEEEQIELLQLCSMHLHKETNMMGGTLMVLVKDIGTNLKFEKETECSKVFSPLHIPPAMCLDIRVEWIDINGYFSSLKSKYRTRFKKAIQRCESIVIKNLSLEEILSEESKIYTFYLNIAKKAGFNMCYLHENYFSKLKEHLCGRLQIYGIYNGEIMIGFYSTIQGYHTIEAHFLGYDLEANRKYDLYLNILLRMLKFTIDLGVKDLYLARTAQEIKSSIGAKPVYYYNYLKHKNDHFNLFVPKLLEILVPEEKLSLRNPFKA